MTCVLPMLYKVVRVLSFSPAPFPHPSASQCLDMRASAVQTQRRWMPTPASSAGLPRLVFFIFRDISISQSLIAAIDANSLIADRFLLC